MSAAPDGIHATCVALDGRAVLLVGRSGAGKSDLAMRLIDRGWVLVSDDYTLVEARGAVGFASPPATIAGRIEVRGVGIVEMPYVRAVPIALLCDLDAPVERMPEAAERTVAGVVLPWLALAALEPSAPLKIEHALARIAK